MLFKSVLSCCLRAKPRYKAVSSYSSEFFFLVLVHVVSRVSTERMRIRKIRISLATDLAEKHVLKLVEGFFWSLSCCLRAKPRYKAVSRLYTPRPFQPGAK